MKVISGSGRRLCGSLAQCHGMCFRLLLLFVLLISPAGAWAQAAVQPVWQGILRNPAGAPIPDARVRLASTAAKAEAVTGADGRFQLSALPAGQYRLSVESNGRKFDYAQLIDLDAAAPAVVLTLSNRGELTVAALKSQTATGGEELSSQAVSELPLNKRDFSTLLLLAAGTMTDANGATNFTAQFAINGQRGVEATFAMDGADISDPEMGGATFSNFNVDAVEGIDSSLRLDARRDRPRRRRASPTSAPAPAPAAFTDRSSSSSATPPSTRATTSTTPRPCIPAAFRPSAATSSASPTAARSSFPTSIDGRKRTFYFFAVPGLPAGAGNHAGDARAHAGRARRH